MYEIGDYLVKSVDGVCKVEDILHLNISGVDKNRLYYLLLPIDNTNEKIYIPTDMINSTIRKVMTEEEVWNLINRIQDIEEIWVDNERIREHIYREAVRSCKPEDLIGIIKMTYLRKKKRLEQGRKNTVVDERYFKIAENNLYSELGFVLNKDKNEVCKLITDSINKKANVR